MLKTVVSFRVRRRRDHNTRSPPPLTSRKLIEIVDGARRGFASSTSLAGGNLLPEIVLNDMMRVRPFITSGRSELASLSESPPP